MGYVVGGKVVFVGCGFDLGNGWYDGCDVGFVVVWIVVVVGNDVVEMVVCVGDVDVDVLVLCGLEYGFCFYVIDFYGYRCDEVEIVGVG